MFGYLQLKQSEELLRIRQELSKEQPLLPQIDTQDDSYRKFGEMEKVDLLMDAFSKVQSHFPGAELVIVGDGPEMENLKKQARDLKIGSRVIFTGEILR